MDKILLGKRVTGWRNDIDGCLRFLEEIPYKGSIHGQKWVVKMIEYYTEKAKELLRQPPPKCLPFVHDYRRRLTVIGRTLDNWKG